MIKQMTDEHRQANEQARIENRAVSAYLSALENNRPKRGRKPNKESVQKKLDDVKSRYESATPLQRVQLIQKRINLEQTLKSLTESNEMDSLESAFVGVVKPYSKRKGISYQAWREVGVPPAVLKRGGVPYGYGQNGFSNNKPKKPEKQ